ncbi:hypothetical protein C1Y40_00051 [Mycobacterium talmoniae]|uniref:Uncharacterized protein n=1 Tax=Mycobacterium talmoniae TaxID=1858794 RepID=A0A2S8BSU5_9MYCO|nr:hypothetical protein C1Y40_00051 [Mycobacterium talmoniae]
MARNDPVPAAATNSAAGPNPATSCAPTCRISTSSTSVLMPNTIRCAANPDRVAATVGRSSTVRAPYSQPVITR